MKQIMTISAALLFLTIGKVQAQNGIEQVLKNIETNNKELQANEQLITSQKLEAKTDNNLPDPTLSYAHLWGAKDKSETIGELVVSQSFDFPSLYATRNKLNRLKAGAFDSQSDVFRQEKLLQAKELCLDIIMLRQQSIFWKNASAMRKNLQRCMPSVFKREMQMLSKPTNQSGTVECQNRSVSERNSTPQQTAGAEYAEW